MEKANPDSVVREVHTFDSSLSYEAPLEQDLGKIEAVALLRGALKSIEKVCSSHQLPAAEFENLRRLHEVILRALLALGGAP